MTPAGTLTALGGIALGVATFLTWQDFGRVSVDAWDRGLNGVFLFTIALVAVAVPVITARSPRTVLPAGWVGLTRGQTVAALGAVAFVISFSLLFAFEGVQIGTLLACGGSAAIVVGGPRCAHRR